MQDLSKFRHTLRTPLNHIIGYTEMLIEDATAERQGEAVLALREILGAAQALVQMVQRRLSPPAGILDPAEIETLRADSVEPLGAIRRAADRVEQDRNIEDIRRIRGAASTLEEILVSAAPPAAHPEALVSGQILPLSPGRILIVDDDAMNRELLERQLERLGFSTEIAESGRVALEVLAWADIDLVLLDLIMPEMDGFQVLSALKANPQWKNIGVIMTSALDEMPAVAQCIEMGADDFISKPFDSVLLRSRIGTVLKRREAEAQRKELAERFHLLLESTGEGIFGIDPSGSCTFINAAAVRMLGYSREELLGKFVHGIIHGQRFDGSPYPPESCPMLAAARNGTASRVADEVLTRADGSCIPVEYSSNPMVHDGEIQGAVITFADVSERKKTEERFRQTAKLESLGVLAGGIAHDFNNLLTGILGNASLLADSPHLSEFDRDRMSDIVKASERAADLTRQMLAYAGKGRYEIAAINISRVVRESAELIHSFIPKTVRLEFDLLSTVSPVEADGSQIQQVVMNLLINAGEAIGEPNAGTIRVRTAEEFLEVCPSGSVTLGDWPPGLYVLLEVSDNGPGMAPAIQAKIFDPFFTTKFTGRGLGLAAVLGIVKSHKGAIQVESEEGKGTLFRVWLPASEKEAQRTASPGAHRLQRGSGTILVVDDEEIIRNTTRAVLRANGFDVVLASGGEEALSLFQRNPENFDLVLLDMMMPGMTGEQAFRHIRVIRENLPVIVSSGYAESEVMRYFSGRKVSAFLQKPYTKESLLAKVAAVLSQVSV